MAKDNVRVTRAIVSRRKNEFGEWIVRAYTEAGRRPEADYFTDDKDDANATAAFMEGRPRVQS